MTPSHTLLILTAFLMLGLGLVVLLANPTRHQNRAFFSFSLNLALWALFVFTAITALHRGTAETAIRLACYSSILIPLALQVLFRAIENPLASLRRVLWDVRYHVAVNQIVGLSVFTPFFIRGVLMPGTPGYEGTLPAPVYGPLWHLMNLYIVVAFVALLAASGFRLRKVEGIKRAETQFILLGVTMAVALGIVTQIVLPLATGNMTTQQYGPVTLLALVVTMAYGIATRRMLDIPTVLQRAFAFTILATYLTCLYLAVYHGTNLLWGDSADDKHHISHFVAALAVAFSMAPMYGLFQQVARRLFITTQHRDIGRIVRVSRERFTRLSTIDEMLSQCVEIIREGGLDPESVHLLLDQAGGFLEHRLSGARESVTLRLPSDAALPELLRHHSVPICVDTYARARSSPAELAAVNDIANAGANLALGISFQSELRGILLLGRRHSGRIYSSSDQDALQLMCDQMATALENTRLYTELQNSKLYSEILLENLVSGVIAVDSDQRITTFNREAQRITGLSPDAVLHHPLTVLPEPLANALQNALAEPQRAGELETLLQRPNGEEVPVSVGSSRFRGHYGKLMGALILVDDLTKVKALESQVRRSDRLASVGTLSAGMAHEIKNPLVTIKTFTQLLPERYMDEDFRLTFSELISHEVNRIDSIVNQLLHFSRPAQPQLAPASLHQMVRNALRLLNEPMRQNGIHLVTDVQADTDVILADPDLLTQALINFGLNAIQSMSHNGTLTLSTRNTTPLWARGRLREDGQPRSYVCLDVQDTGIGIPADILGHIFDPFFTTKEEGTGLGLSISHGIISDHHGSIDVESEPGKGTVFHIYFPVLEEASVTA